VGFWSRNPHIPSSSDRDRVGVSESLNSTRTDSRMHLKGKRNCILSLSKGVNLLYSRAWPATRGGLSTPPVEPLRTKKSGRHPLYVAWNLVYVRASEQSHEVRAKGEEGRGGAKGGNWGRASLYRAFGPRRHRSAPAQEGTTRTRVLRIHRGAPDNGNPKTSAQTLTLWSTVNCTAGS
jgi:hypothetical protein